MTRGISQDYLLRYSQCYPGLIKRWVKYYRVLDEYHSSGRLPENNSTLLHIASSAGLLSVVRGILLKNPDIEQIDDSGNRALHHASRWGHAKVVKALLEIGANFEAENHSKCTALERAAANGHEEVAQMLVTKGANVNRQTGWTGNALCGAAAKGSKIIVQLLLDHQAKVNAQGGRYGNALQAAAFGGHQAIVQLLLQNADLNYLHPNFAEDHRLQAPGTQEIITILLGSAAKIKSFHSDVQEGRDSAVASALESGMKPDVPGGLHLYALHTAAGQGNLSIVALLLAKSNAELNITDFAGRTPLWLAARSGHISVLDKLFESGTVDINPQDLEGRSAHWQSSARGDRNAVEWLLSRNADPDIPDNYGMSPLEKARIEGNKSVIEALIPHSRSTKTLNITRNPQFGIAILAFGFYWNADLNYLHPNFAEDHRLQAPGTQEIITILLGSAAKIKSFHSDVQEGRDSAVASALESGMKPDVPGGLHLYALHTAAGQGNLSIVALLLAKSNAELNITDFAGRTPLWLAARSGHISVLDKLFESGTVDINPQDLEGRSAHWQSSARGDRNAVEWLLSRNADPDIPDNYGMSPLEKARIEGNKSVIEALIPHSRSTKTLNITRNPQFGIAILAFGFYWVTLSCKALLIHLGVIVRHRQED
ncbi:hypothetical protein HYALB_00013738 [Hymenoscyphus albidus]|uniref:Ankyrin n=1 Tax=Hymenoscyphus albidus TaxID=595503 RepID=A0A9N9QAU7_9HELO|nr:hypothetical protein HYALB_00013738 [Hymenoscyphus albidus]